MSIKNCFFVFSILFTSNFIFADDPQNTDIYEEFALSDKREDVLKKLIPGTEIYYFLHTLYFQQTNKIKESTEMLAKWEERLSTSPQIKTMKNRQALLSFENSPKETYQFLKDYLNLNFDHEKPETIGATFYPSTLNPDIYNHEIEFNQLLSTAITLEKFSQSGLYQLSKKNLTPELLQNLLDEYSYGDLPNIIELILKDFKNYDKRSFGTLNAHKVLTLSQLMDLKNKKPDILTHETFVRDYLAKLNSHSKLYLQKNPLELKKYLQSCWSFSKDLKPSFNNIKANILFAYLKVCLETNQPDFVLFKEYLKFPRQTNYANIEFYKKNSHSNEFIQYDNSFSEFIQVPPINSDNSLVESYLFKLIKSGANMTEYKIYFENSYYHKFEAETKIKTGLGKPEEFYQILLTSDLENLKNSVEISFTEENLKFHLTNDPAKLTLQVKNVNELEIHVYKINTLDFYRNKNQIIDQNISLEGYIPNITKKISYQQPSFIRHEEVIEMTEITTPGEYIIELYGNGIKTRTFISKGTIFPAIYESNNGHEIQLFDDSQNQIINYTVYFGKHEMKSNDKGIVMLPYTDEENRGLKNLIFSYQELACLHQFYHKSENYEFSNLILNHLESLIPRQNAKILFRPSLKLNGKPIGTSVLKDVVAEIQTRNSKNEILSSKTYPIKALEEINEISFYIPESSAILIITLSGYITKKVDGENFNVSITKDISLAGAFSDTNIFGLYLRKQKDNYQLECLNKAGIPQGNVSVRISLYHQYLKNPYTTTLQTDAKGNIYLGALANITYLEALNFNHQYNAWKITDKNLMSIPDELSALENDPLELSVDHTDKNKLTESFLLLKKNNDFILEDRTKDLKIENQILIIPTDTAGQYSLICKKINKSISIYILKGKKQNKYLVSAEKISDISAYLPHQIIFDPIDEKSDLIQGRILNLHKNLKAYLWSGRYYSYIPVFSSNYGDEFEWPFYQRELEQKFNRYFDSIKLSSEQKYIIDRKDIVKFPGNLLPMPSAILNPWDTSLAEGNIGGEGGGGGSFGSRSGGGRKRAIMRGGGSRATESGTSKSLEFFPNATIQEIAIQNDGRFKINIKEFDDQSFFQIGVISPYAFIIKDLPFVSSATKLLDIRQTKTNSILDNKLPTTSMSIIQPDKPMTFLQGEEKEIYTIDSLGKLYSTLKEISGHSKMIPFHFLGNWNSLKESEKLSYYKDFACHELHFYIFQKDKKFFDSQIKPFLINKQLKTFIDQWLLDEDLSTYLNLNQFNKLNLFEKILLTKKHPALKEKVILQIKEYLEVHKPNRENEIKLMNQLLNSEVRQDLSKASMGGLYNPEMENEKLNELSSDLVKKEKSIEPIVEKLEKVNVDGDENLLLIESDIENIELYRDVEETKEYVEAYYYHMLRADETTNLIQPSQFWLDYLNNSNSIFISESILSLENIHEVLLAFALIDLPEAKIETAIETKENQITIKAKSPIIVLLKSFKTGNYKPETINLKQHYFTQNADKKDIMASNKPFLINKQYGCLSVITNTTSEIKEFYLNSLIPEGSLPLDKTLRRQQQFISVQPFTSFIWEHHFFFPLSGTFSHLPAKVIDQENIFTNEKIFPLIATADQEALDKNSWEYHVKEGNKDKILTYIKTHNLLKINFADIYFLVKDKSFFETLTSELRSKYYFEPGIWSYSVYHEDKIKLIEYLPNTILLNDCSLYFNSLLLKINPLLQGRYEHKEYFPLIKGRSHPVEKGNPFENLKFEAQYNQFIYLLMHKEKLNNSDLLNLVIYTLNQQRISDAIKLFSAINKDEITEKLQYDYLKAYLAFYQEDLPTAELILAKHKNLTIIQWKDKFDELGIQLSEIKSGLIDAKSRGDKFSATVLASKEVLLKAENKMVGVELNYKNLLQCRIDYYLIDLEILFSNNPFEVMNNQFQFLTVPNFSESINLNNNAESQVLKIPESLKNKNLVIKISGAGKESIVTYNPNQMDISISENYGELRIISVDTKKPLSGIYVKVYGDTGSTKDFVKDGYTDLRGIFNYSAVSGKPINQFKNLAILTLSEKHGSAIHYTKPPAH